MAVGEATGWRLDDLQDNWGPACKITPEHGGFRAERRDNGAGTWVPDADQLRFQIIKDHAAGSVPRALP